MWARMPRRAAARASMRPSWPPPRMPMMLPGGRGALFGIVGGESRTASGLAQPQLFQRGFDLVVEQGQHGGGQQGRIGGASLADCQGADGDAGWHLHDRE